MHIYFDLTVITVSGTQILYAFVFYQISESLSFNMFFCYKIEVIILRRYLNVMLDTDLMGLWHAVNADI